MTYEEFKEIIEKSGEYQVYDTYITGVAVYKEECQVCFISKVKIFEIDTVYSDNEDFLKEHLDTIIEFAKTPIRDRYPVKKYYVKLKASDFINRDRIYLNRCTSLFRTTKYEFDTKVQYEHDTDEGVMHYQTQFTMEEIEDIIPKEDMEKFQFIPVEEEK